LHAHSFQWYHFPFHCFRRRRRHRHLPHHRFLFVEEHLLDKEREKEKDELEKRKEEN
jgi:hypothetical protein